MINSTILGLKILDKSPRFSASEITDLKEIANKYPYFQLGAMLNCKSLFTAKDKEYRSYLAKAATIVHDREVFFDYIYFDSLNTNKVSVANNATKKQIVPKPSISTTNTGIKSTNKIEKPKPITDSKGDIIENKKAMMQEVASNLQNNKEEKIAIKKEEAADIKKIEKSTKENILKTPDSKAKNKVEAIKDKAKTAVTASANSSDKKALETKEAVAKVVSPPKADKEVKKKPIAAKKTDKKETKVSKAEAKTKEVKKKTTVKKALDKEVKTTKKKVAKDIATKENKAKASKETAKEKKAVIKKAIIKKKTIPKAKNKKIKPVDRGTTIAIIEKFIKEEPSIKKPSDKEYKEELKIAKDSLSEGYDIVSETMAKLFLAQGNRKKAIKVYEKLILIYPEKNTYFAARISDITKK